MRPSHRLALLTSATTLLTSVTVGLTTPAQAAGPVFGNGAPAFVMSEPDLTLPLGPALQWNHPDQSGEPSIGIDWRTGKGLYMAGANVLRVSFDDAANTVSWADASPYFGTTQNLDPILATDPTTGTTIGGGDTGACSVMFRSTDDGGSWLPSVPCSGTTDHPSVGWAPSAVHPGSHVWYFCQQQSLQACATSTDDGVVWVPGSTDAFLDCEHYHGHIRGSADGTTYLPSNLCFDANSNTRVGGLRTTDDGATWDWYTIPTAAQPDSGFDPAVATTPDNTLYQAWNQAGDHHPVIASSHDHGTTWGTTTDLAGTVSPPLVAATFPTLVAGDNGRVAYSFLGTSAGDPTKDPFASGFHGVWYLYTSYTYDGGQTWTTVKDTPTPVQYGEIDSGGTTTSGQRNLLDFMDSALTKDGRVVVGFADGCLSDCESATSQTAAESLSTHAWTAVAYQTAGRGLFSAYDVVLPPSAPTLAAVGGANDVALTWTAPTDDGGAPVTSYQVWRDGTQVGTSTGLEYLDPAPRGTHSYTVRAVNSGGTSADSNAVSVAIYAVPAAPVLTVTGTATTAQLTWTVPDDGGAPISDYEVLRATASGAETRLATATGTTYTDAGLTTGTTYYYEVRAANAAGSGPASSEVVYATASPPAAPLLTATAGRGLVRLSWTAPADGGAPITSYQIYRGTATGTETLVQSITTGTAYIDGTVTGGTTYFYRVAAVNAAGVGTLSNEAFATPKKG